MLPDLTDDGFLPPGIFQASLDELRQRFAFFSRSNRRVQDFENFSRLFEETHKSGIVRKVILAGSLMTDKPEPNDFDCILVLDPGIVGQTLRPFEYNLVSRRMARRVFGGDVLPALDGSTALQNYLDFFQVTRDGTQVGVVEVLP